MVKFTLQLLLISLMTLLASAFISFHVGLAIYLLGSTIALLNYEKKWKRRRWHKSKKKLLVKFITLYKKTIEDKSTEYKHKIKDGNTKWTEIVNREKNLEAFIEWTLQQIENNFDGVK